MEIFRPYALSLLKFCICCISFTASYAVLSVRLYFTQILHGRRCIERAFSSETFLIVPEHRLSPLHLDEL